MPPTAESRVIGMRHFLFSVFILVIVPVGCAGAGIGSGPAGATHRPPASESVNPVPMAAPLAGNPAGGRARVDSSLLAAVNQARSRARKCGSVFHAAAAPVAWSDKMGNAALKHAGDMASKGFLSHTGSDDSSSDERLSREGYPWRTVGENIAVGQSTAAEVVRDWLTSEGHCRNIMSPDFHEIGAAYAFGPYQGSHFVKYWTLVLGSRR